MKKAKKVAVSSGKAVVKNGRTLNAFTSRDQEDDWQWSDTTITAASRALPDKLDLRRKVRSKWSEPFDQGQTGSCVGQAVAKARWWHLLKDGKIPSSRQQLIPSVKYLWSAPKEFDIWEAYPSTMLQQSGTYIKSSLDILRKHGCPPDKVLPFDSPGSMLPDKDFNKIAARYKIKAYRAVSPTGTGFDYEGYRWWLANRGPIVTRLDVDHAFMMARQNTGVLKEYGRRHRYGGHAILIIGYNEDENFLVMNSWGTRWGNTGVLWVSRKYAKAAFTESYGLET